MPTQPFDRGWDFGPVLDLIDSDLQHDVDPPALVPISQALVLAPKSKQSDNHEATQSLHLGSFGKLFEELGISSKEPLPPVSPGEPDSEEPSSSDDALLPPVVEATDTQPVIKDDADPSSALKELGVRAVDDPYAGMTRKQQHQARKKAEKECKSQEELEKELGQRKQVQKSLRELVESSVPDTRTRNGPAPKQTRAQSRSNVGAKIRPATPVQLDPPINVELHATPAIPKRISITNPTNPPIILSSPASQSFNTFRKPSTPDQAEHTLPSSHRININGPYPPVTNLGSALTTQYVAFGTPTTVQHASPAPHLSAYGYFAPQASSTVYGHGLVPRTVQPVVLQRPAQHVVCSQSAGRSPGTVTIRPQVDRHLHFLNQLVMNFPGDKKWLVSPMQLCNEKTSIEGIHVFVDASNIMIGFRAILREYGVQPFDMSFDSLALLMERRRPVAKRVFAGSHREAAPLPHVAKLVETSRAVGYENNVKEQVFIRREDTEKKRFFKDVKRLGWAKASQRRSGDSSSDPEMGPLPATPSAPKWVEQGVDEILHLKMCQSIIDTEVPTTMVLATGDGAEAEHSDGFLAHVERALKKGWKVELVSWRQQISGGYKNKRFRARWADRFRIIELDEYLESLIDTP